MSRPTTLPTPRLARDASPGDLGAALAEHARGLAARLGAGDAPRTFFAPGRVNLFGGHLDYNGGPVMPTAIDRGTFIAARPRADGRLHMASMFDGEVFEGSVQDLPAEAAGRWFDYPLGVVRALREGRPAAFAGGADLFFGGNLPVGAGLSSSASITVGTAFALDRTLDLGLEPADRVSAALEAERGFVGVQCGIMDPYAVGYAKPRRVLWLDCKDASFEHLPLDFDRLVIGVFDTGVQRALARSEFNRRVAECREAFEALRAHAPGATVMRDIPLGVVEEHLEDLAPATGRRALHVAREVERTFAAREAVLAGDHAALGRAMSETHRSLRDLYECSSEELDALVEAACATDGVHGARLTGAGFGGCVVALMDAEAEERAWSEVGAAYRARFGVTPPAAFFRGDSGPREVTD